MVAASTFYRFLNNYTKSPVSSFTTRHPVGGELIHADGHEDILLEATKQRTCFVSLPVAAWMYVRTTFSNITISI